MITVTPIIKGMPNLLNLSFKKFFSPFFIKTPGKKSPLIKNSKDIKKMSLKLTKTSIPIQREWSTIGWVELI